MHFMNHMLEYCMTAFVFVKLPFAAAEDAAWGAAHSAAATQHMHVDHCTSANIISLHVHCFSVEQLKMLHGELPTAQLLQRHALQEYEPFQEAISASI
jgi:hypothetical protein